MQSRPGFEFFLSSGAACYSTFEKIYMSLVPTIAAVNDFCMGLGIGLVPAGQVVGDQVGHDGIPFATVALLDDESGPNRALPSIPSQVMHGDYL